MREKTSRYASAGPLLHTRKRHMYAHAPPMANCNVLCVEHCCIRSMNRPFVVQTPMFEVTSMAHELALAF